VVPDGMYYYTLSAWDENNNKTTTEKGTLIVDNVIPMVEAETDQLLFSPNDDGVKDILKITVRSANIESEDQVIYSIEDRDGNVVFEDIHKGPVGDEWVWNGRDQSGAQVKEGIYQFSISALDLAGNKTESVIDDIIVRTEYEKISASPSLKAFSPNGDGYSDINDIRLFSSGREGLINWDLKIVNGEGETVRQYQGEKIFPDIISFDGKDSLGIALPDGLYTIEFHLFFESGNHPESFFKFIKIDNTPPKIDIATNITAFSPNGDGVKDTISIVHEIEYSEGDVFEAKIVNAAGATFKTFQYGTSPPKAVVWDGMGDDNRQPVEGAYTYIMSGKDKVGNAALKSIGPIKLATGFEEVSVEPGDYVFSPNADGVKDTVSCKLHTTRGQGIVEWKLDISDRNKVVVRSFNNRNMGMIMPAEVVWDGKDTAGAGAEDGTYTAVLSLLYDTGNNPISKPKDIQIDTKPPAIEIFIEDLNISPNNDGAKETLTIYQRIRGQKDDFYTGEIKDSGGMIVKSFNWQGNPPVEIVWDGRDEGGTSVREGMNSYSVTGSDAAGNRAGNSITDIVLTTSYEKVSIAASERGISPNNDGYFDTVNFMPGISSDKNLLSWHLPLLNSQGKKVKVIEASGIPQSSIMWDGKDDNGDQVPDGEYSYALGLFYKSGNHPVSDSGLLIVDTSPPDYHFIVSPKLFSPDSDGEADTLYINTELNDKNEVTDWDITIYRKWDETVDRSVPFKRFSGQGNYKRTLRWDGYSDPMQMPTGFTPPDQYTYRPVGNKWAILVDSASNYVAELKASDTYMNNITVTRDFRTDILVIKTPEGLKIMINSIEFEFDKADLLPQSYPILNRLIEILEKFPSYKIRVTGHTDSIGTDEYNKKLSERRAFSVYKFLVAHDVDKERLTTEGKGEKYPIDDNEMESGRARNRRVEFYLTR